jgi:two-component system OmpR family sensor kinase
MAGLLDREVLHPSTWALRTKLVAGVLLLFLGLSALTGSITVFALRSSLNAQLDQDLRQVAQRVDRDGDGDAYADGSPSDRPELPGVPPGGGNRVLRVVLDNDQVVTNMAVTTDNRTGSLTDAQITELRDAGLCQKPKTVQLGGDIGDYRLVASRTPTGTTAITGLPVAGTDETVQNLLVIIVAVTTLGLLAVAVGGTYLVRRSLAPLDRVAATASRVSRLELHSGDVALAERVPPRDVDSRTEVGQVGLALNSMLDNVDSALQARHESETRVRQFVADASHELRTPLSSIRGYAELSRKVQEPVPPTVTHALRRVESESLRMQELVEDLLLLARLDDGRPLAREEVDLSRLAVDAVGDARVAAPDHVWELDLPSEPVEVMGDESRLHQVLANLLANARTHTPAGSHVTAAVARRDGEVTISVTDNGPGVPPALQPEVFERFTRGDDSRDRASGSTGLGLSIVAAVTRAHGGRVDMSSTPGSTRFSVHLPA